jgi:hypothetical protein
MVRGAAGSAISRGLSSMLFYRAPAGSNLLRELQ